MRPLVPAPGAPLPDAAQPGPPRVSRPFRLLGVGLAIAILLGGWAWLFLQARDVDLRAQNEVLGYLRALKEIDNRWNDRVVGARLADAAVQDPAASPATPISLSITLHKLSVQAQRLANPLLNQSITALKEAFGAKVGAVDNYWAAHVGLRESLAAYNQAALGGGGRGSLAVARMSAALSNLLTQPNGDTRKVALGVLAEVEAAGATEAARAARTVIERKLAEEGAFRAALYTSTGPRIDTITRQFDQEFESALQEAELYRMYLLLYSGFLLAVLALLGARLASSYQVISRINRALRDANEGLEQRVGERTRDLSRALAQLKESEALLIQSEKMSSLGQMVAGMAHEVNTPLAYVKSSLENVSMHLPRIVDLEAEAGRLLAMLQGEEADEQKLAGQFARVQGLVATMREEKLLPDMQGLLADGLHGIARISELVANLRNFSRLDRGKMGEIDLNEAVESALVIARNLVKHRNVRRELGKLPKILCAPSQINQVLLNLVNNAAQATGEGGSLTVRTGVRDAGKVFVEVEDNGHGIPEDVLPKIFDPFFTTKDVGQGTGLGLSIAYRIVEQHGGRILVASKVGVGTRFVVELPLAAAPAAAVAA